MKQVLESPAGFEDNRNICRVCGARVSTVNRACSCGSIKIANPAGYYYDFKNKCARHI